MAITKEKARFPPRRGQIKVRIISSIIKLVVELFSKPVAGRRMEKKKQKVILEEAVFPLPYGL